MNKFNKSQLLVLFVLALLLGITPLLASSFRRTYLYLIFNVLIIALGAEAGLLSGFSKPLEDKKQAFSVTNESEEREMALKLSSASDASEHDEKKPKVVHNCDSVEKISVSVGVTEVDKVKRCPSKPNLLFIVGGESELGEVMDEDIEVEDEVGGVNGQELFAKAEAFIGNFYKELKMQQEESLVY